MIKIKDVIFVFLFLFSFTVESQEKGDEQGLEILSGLQLPEDKDGVIEAYNTWWKKSNETLSERMAWFSNAKFGCFIHWGVYSVPAGVWNGESVGGYTEHLMRKSKIPFVEYMKELVLPFNPVQFDADQWMRNIRDGGMKYVVVTAKHHDGFAMYFSDAYPYDMSLTKYNRDPMLELRQAARKYGIKFGFYYSHAFDWEHPCAPGNDWDYLDHPGGDRLVGGRDWWLNLPSYLPIANKYVEEKSIPQVQELIRKYDPDLMWFDTPHKLPLYQNIRILKAIREIDHENKIVVNGRLARFGDQNMGDYINSGDRAAYFYPIEGFWESIPTTNDSYGYSIVDTIRKPVRHFVQLLASAAAKGGNILLNVGPMGNGEWNEKDVAICKGVGDWLNLNGEAIYGVQKTDLPIQSWGVTTQKADSIYAHVFEWPKDGKLTIGGLVSEIDRGWILSGLYKTPITFLKINEKDIQINLPEIVPDSMNTVIKLVVKKKKPSYPVRLLDDKISNILFAFDAEKIGEGLKYGDGKINRNYITQWERNNQWMEWRLRINKSATYDVYLDYNTQGDKNTGVVIINISDKSIPVNYTSHPEKLGKKRLFLGKVRLKEGEFNCSLKGVKYTGSQYLNPIAIRLEKIN